MNFMVQVTNPQGLGTTLGQVFSLQVAATSLFCIASCLDQKGGVDPLGRLCLHLQVMLNVCQVN